MDKRQADARAYLQSGPWQTLFVAGLVADRGEKAARFLQLIPLTDRTPEQDAELEALHRDWVAASDVAYPVCRPRLPT